MDMKNPKYKLVTRLGKVVRHGKYFLFDYETADAPGVLKVQRLRESEAREIFRQLRKELEAS